MSKQVDRRQFMESFSGIVPILEDVIGRARKATNHDRIARAIPEITRRSGIARLSGTGRWILAADGLVDRAPDFPDGFYLHSNDSDHNQGKYIFGFRLGVFTFKREPHEEDKGLYLQETLDALGVKEQEVDGIDAFANLKAYISIPPKEIARVIVEQPEADPMICLLDEFEAPGKVVTEPRRKVDQSVVRSTRTEPSETEAEQDNS
jgi:hypothetical protein